MEFIEDLAKLKLYASLVKRSAEERTETYKLNKEESLKKD